MKYIAFKHRYSFDQRSNEAKKILSKYPDRVPVIVEKHYNCKMPNINKNKYLVPGDLTVGQFLYVIRKRIKINPCKAIFLFVDGILPPTSELMQTLYEEKKEIDNFLYITYSSENVFG